MTTPRHPVDPLVARVTSPWTIRERLMRLAWYWVEGTLFRFSPRPFYRSRNLLLRLFGARVDWSCRIRSTVKTEVPWHLEMGSQTIVGDDVILYCLGQVTIGRRVTISQLGHLCAGTHDYTRHDFPLLRPPINIGDDVWLAADVFVARASRLAQGRWSAPGRACSKIYPRGRFAWARRPGRSRRGSWRVRPRKSR